MVLFLLSIVEIQFRKKKAYHLFKTIGDLHRFSVHMKNQFFVPTKSSPTSIMQDRLPQTFEMLPIPANDARKKAQIQF